MNANKIIAVVGATGAQGGGLVRAIQADPGSGYRARAITRDPGSDKARALAALGAEVAAADLDDQASLERALDGAHAAYFVTFYWDHLSPERELAQARNLAQAAKAAGTAHVVWSTLEDTRRWVPLDDDRMPTLMGRYKVPHFDAKGEANHVFTGLGVPTTFLLTSFYWDNFINFGMGPRRGVDGKLAITLPMGRRKLPGIAAEDIGHCAFGVFKQGERAIGKTVGIAGEHLTGAQMAAEFGRALGQEVRYHAVSPEAYRRFGFPGADDLANMFQFKHDFEDYYCGVRTTEIARALYPGLQTFRSWLAANRHRLGVEAGQSQG
ncbi:MAG TPA: NmrA/HSCARG family protein [Candidatus Krumholzibacteria bacterium]|nr:NmrA/HSCARG family protein [Candidatus Krumholzibacteria bacterium]HPD70626.1 NmrA/HSCARG family protein [Candidatus Krumholzibacteria bacterium]HRY39674.1 NmrA/HSCARG family protein [Candidatus Krumholzibacteria bacterium]